MPLVLLTTLLFNLLEVSKWLLVGRLSQGVSSDLQAVQPAVLRAEAEQHDAAPTEPGRVHQRVAALKQGIAQQPAGHQRVAVRIAGHRRGAGRAGALKRQSKGRAVLKPGIVAVSDCAFCAFFFHGLPALQRK